MPVKNTYHWALTAAFTVAILYGCTYSIAKDVMPAHIQPFGFILLRVGGSTMLFWLLSLIWPGPVPRRADLPRLLSCSLLGIAINMLTFFKGLSLTTPIMASVLMLSTPLLVFVLSLWTQTEARRPLKMLGIALGMGGAATLILYGRDAIGGPQAAWGNALVFVNALSYALYLIRVKPLMQSYPPFTLIKWIYTFGLLMVLPFGWAELQEVHWSALTFDIGWRMGFVVVGSTFLTYLLNLWSMQQLKPSTVAGFIYLQPLFAAGISLAQGKDQLDGVKMAAAVLIFAGVFLISKKQD